MAVHVRVRDSGALRARVIEVVRERGTHADLAFSAGLSPARLSQVLSETAPVIKLAQAALLEDALGVPRGTFFVLDDPDAHAEAVGPYIAVDPE